MLTSLTIRDEQAALLALVESAKSPWHTVADLVEAAGSASAVVRGDVQSEDAADIALLNQVRSLTLGFAVERWHRALEDLARTAPAVHLVTVLDPAYPRNLRMVYNRPPFLFVRGELRTEDENAVAIVGTREPSSHGLAEASALAEALSRKDVTIISGLARGIDTSVHEATLRAGGRTLAVIGTGIRRTYPPENEQLAQRIVGSGGALISQFWPDAPPMASNFPLRNAVMSGMAIGTVVIEASSTSGAKMQARLALEHGKRLFLLESLVLSQDWARRYADRPGAVVVKRSSDVLEILAQASRPAEQLQLA
ncbi:MAG: DNA-processing protein DprA [Chloroflexota bacterium]